MKVIQSILLLLFVVVTTSCGSIGQEKQQQDLSLDSFKEIYSKDKTIQLVDVRTQNEYEKGHIYDAENIDFLAPDFKAKMEALDKDQPIYLYCQSGGRSTKASLQLQEFGFKEIYNLKEGYGKWNGD